MKKGFDQTNQLILEDPALRRTMKPSRVEMHLIESSAAIQQSFADEISYQHTALCQTGLPYREVTERRWERRTGRVLLEIEAGRALIL